MNVVAGCSCGIAPACCDGSLTALRSVTAGATGPTSFLWAEPAALGTFAAGGVRNRRPRNPCIVGSRTACAVFRRCTGRMAMLLRWWCWRVPVLFRVVFRVVVPLVRLRRAEGVGLPCSHPCHPCLLCLLYLCPCHLYRVRGLYSDIGTSCGQFVRSRSRCHCRRVCHPRPVSTT